MIMRLWEDGLVWSRCHRHPASYMCMCVYIYIHVCVHIYMCIYTMTRTYTHIEMRNWFGVSCPVGVYTHIYTHTYIHTYTHYTEKLHIHTYIHTYIHTCRLRADVGTYDLTDEDALTYIHMCRLRADVGTYDLTEEDALTLILEKRGNITEATAIARAQTEETRAIKTAQLLAGMRRSLAAMQASPALGVMVDKFVGARTLDQSYAAKWLNVGGNDVDAALEAFTGSVKEWCCRVKTSVALKRRAIGMNVLVCVCVCVCVCVSKSSSLGLGYEAHPTAHYHEANAHTHVYIHAYIHRRVQACSTARRPNAQHLDTTKQTYIYIHTHTYVFSQASSGEQHYTQAK
jgi:hypothetical protein